MPRRWSPLFACLFVFACTGEDPEPPKNACDPNPCFTGVDCTEANGTFACGDCPDGYEGDGVTCADVDGCSGGPCFDGVTCMDVPAPGTGFSCGDCPAGYEGDGVTCTDADGCAGMPCFTGVMCTDVTAPGVGFMCGDCPAGYEGDGETCTDIDGCAGMPCFAGVMCMDVAAPGDGFTCGDCPAGYEGDGITCTNVDGCAGMPCFAGVQCIDAVAPETGFTCGDCPPGLEGDGQTCTEIDGCAGDPCLQGSTCTDIPAPGDGFTCTPCMGPNCPILRALAGPDQEIVTGTVTTILGDAVGFNGAFGCEWTNDQDATVISTCSATVAPTVETVYTLTVTDASGMMATDEMVIRLVAFSADAGPSRNIRSTWTATLTASWQGASCPGTSCITCSWATSDGTVVGNACTLMISPAVTTQYFLTVTDTGANQTATDSATVFVIDQVANLCGWNVVVMTSNEYPTSPNPNYICDNNNAARRQTVNGKPAIVLSDLQVDNVRIVGHISVETTSDDDLIGFLWGWQSPAHTYLLTWKQFNQNWTAACGNALAGLAIKKIDGPVGSSTTVSFNPSFGFNATDYVYNCADLWSTDRNNSNLLSGNTTYLESPRDVGGVTRGWADNITYRAEFYYTPTRTRILIYSDDMMTGDTSDLVASFTVVDSSYPVGAFAFFSNSQAQVAFGDFVLASLDDYAALAGPDVTVASGGTVTLQGSADLAVPPYLCEWSVGGMLVASTCDYAASPSATTIYELTITDDFGRVATDDVMVTVTP